MFFLQKKKCKIYSYIIKNIYVVINLAKQIWS